jgi:hypothetical protein
VLIEGITGCRKEVVLAARNAVVTVEEIVEDLRAPSPNSTVLPHWTIAAVAVAPGGARPSYAHGYYAATTPSISRGTSSRATASSSRAGCASHVADGSAAVEAVAWTSVAAGAPARAYSADGDDGDRRRSPPPQRGRLLRRHRGAVASPAIWRD